MERRGIAGRRRYGTAEGGATASVDWLAAARSRRHHRPPVGNLLLAGGRASQR